MHTPTGEEKLRDMIVAMKADGITPCELARRVGVSRTTLWRLEVGEASKVRFQTFERIERAYQSREMRR